MEINALLSVDHMLRDSMVNDVGENCPTISYNYGKSRRLSGSMAC